MAADLASYHTRVENELYILRWTKALYLTYGLVANLITVESIYGAEKSVA